MREERFLFWFRVTDPIKFEGQSIGNAEAVLKLAREWAKVKKLPKLTTDELGIRLVWLWAYCHVSWRGDKDEVRQMATKVVNEWGNINILVNNAGDSLHVPADDITEEQWDKVTDLNLKPDFRQ